MINMDKNNRKTLKVLFSAVVIALLIILGGCESLDSRTDYENPCMNIDFKNGQTIYDGTEQWVYQVEEGQTGELEIRVSRVSGSISICVFRTDEPAQYSYRGTNMPTSDFVVALTEPGEYKVWVEAETFAGSYSVNLLEENAK